MNRLRSMSLSAKGTNLFFIFEEIAGNLFKFKWLAITQVPFLDSWLVAIPT